MSREQELTLGLLGSKLLDDALRDECVVKVVFRLIHDQGIGIVQQQQMQDCRALLSEDKSPSL